MVRVKKTEEEKDIKAINTLKIIGAFVNIIGFYIVIMLTAASVLAEVGASNALLENNLIETLNTIAKNTYLTTTIMMGIVLIYELINYVVYLYKSRYILILSVVIEIATLVVLCVFQGLQIVSIPVYTLVLPIISGIINYFILVLENNK